MLTSKEKVNFELETHIILNFEALRAYRKKIQFFVCFVHLYFHYLTILRVKNIKISKYTIC